MDSLSSKDSNRVWASYLWVMFPGADHEKVMGLVDLRLPWVSLPPNLIIGFLYEFLAAQTERMRLQDFPGKQWTRRVF